MIRERLLMPLFYVQYTDGSYASKHIRKNEHGMIGTSGVSEKEAEVWSDWDIATRCTYSLADEGIQSTVVPAHLTEDELKSRIDDVDHEIWILELRKKKFTDELQKSSS